MRARRITFAIAVALAASCAACAREPQVDRRSVILVTLDTTRFDALSSFGGRAGLTPELDRLAAQSCVYERARSVAPLTLPAHASMLTGLYPPRHGVRNNGPTTLSGDAATVAELARAAGFQTAGFVGGLALDRAYGIAQGFERWTQPELRNERELGEISDRPASAVVADARAWLAQRDRERPFFLWVHVFDAHAPYAPPAPFLERAGGDAYLGEIASYDAALGELFADCEREHLFDSAWLVVVGDHGEARGDHGEDTHSLLVYDATLRVPLFVRHPDGARAGARSSELASVVDVAPTLLDAMQLALPRDLDGLSLAGGALPDERGVYFESFAGWERFGWSPLAGWCDANGKYVHSSRPQFFDVGEDVREERDVIADVAENVAHYREQLAAVYARPALEPAAAALVVDESAARAVAALGYGGGDAAPLEYPDPLARTELPAPQERWSEYAELTRAQALARERRFADAVAALEPLSAANARNVAVLDALGEALVELAQWPRAVEVLERRAALPPERLATHRDLVRAYVALGDADKARAHTLRSLELLIASHELRGEPELARRYRELYESEVGAAGK